MIDLFVTETVTLKAGEDAVLNLGVSMKLPKNHTGIIVPRSSIFKRWGVFMPNSIGIIDNAYCGDSDVWGCPVYALRDTTICKGDRLCQFAVIKLPRRYRFKKVHHLSDNNRGGFGSTGR